VIKVLPLKALNRVGYTRAVQQIHISFNNLSAEFEFTQTIMRFLKLSLIIVVAASVIFIFGCRSANDDSATNVNTNNSAPSPAVSTSPASNPADEFASVRPIFAESCAQCHRDDGAGGIYEAEGRRLRVPSLREGRVANYSDAIYQRQITRGGDGMPAFGDRLSPEQINELVRYIRRTIQNRQ
jgi:mono/diheme cytochrome c family protein